MTAPILRLVSSPPTDEPTKAWEAARPKGDNPKLSPEFRAIVETSDAARGGVDCLIEALRKALQLVYEREDYDEVCAERDGWRNEFNEAISDNQDLEKERDDLQRKLDALAEEDGRLAEANSAREEASAALARERRALDDVEHHKRRQAHAANDAIEARKSLQDMREAFRAIVGDSPDALLLASYWHGRSTAHDAELIMLRKYVAELEAKRDNRKRKGI